MFASFAGGHVFSKLDLSHAYKQLESEEDSQVFTTVNTPKGLFKYNRLPFGISSAPAFFQKIMESLLQGMAGVCVYIDDILVSGSSEEAHHQSRLATITREG